MARDNIKEIIERGKQIPQPKSINMKPGKKPVKVDRHAIAEQPKMSHTVRAHRTNSPIRK